MNVNIDNTSKDYISFVSNDYLGFTQHPKVKQAAIDGIMKYGTGAGASPLIGGHFSYHDDLEKKIATFFGRKDGEAVILQQDILPIVPLFRFYCKKKILLLSIWRCIPV